MRVRNTLVAMAGLALVLPSTALAGGGFLDGARRGLGGQRGGGGAPVHVPAPRSPMPSHPGPYPRSSGGIFGGNAPAPRPAPARSSGGFFGGQGVPRGGQRVAAPRTSVVPGQ